MSIFARLVVAALLLLAACATVDPAPQGAQASPWSAGPVIDGKDFSSPIAIDASGSFDFPTSSPGVHYVTEPCASLAGKTAIVLRYRIDADPGVTFLAASDGVSAAIGPTIYFQRAGDDWSGTGAFEAYRWWATFSTPPLVADGQEHKIDAPLSARWTAVETSNAGDNPSAFGTALANAARCGFTFGGGSGFGHGAFATGRATFTLLSFEVN